MGSVESFGRRAASSGSVAELLKTEAEAERAERFIALDRFTGELVVAAMQGDRPISVEPGHPRTQRHQGVLRVEGISPQQRGLIEERFSVEKQQSRGMWSLPETVTVKMGVAHFAANFGQFGRFAHTAIAEDLHKVSLGGSPEALYYHAVLEPLFEALYEPFALRGEQMAKKGKEEQIRRWEAIDHLFVSLGFKVERDLSVMRYGGGWSRLRATQQLEAKRRLLAALASQSETAMASCHRAHRLMPLLARYYKRADREGRALRGHVLTRELERTVSAYFGGGWLEFLDYLGEEPHPDEHVATVLPEMKLFLGTTRKSASDLGLEGLDEEQIRLITASLYGGQDSPFERRLEVMLRYWEVFDSAHTRQRSGMEPLWGLVAEGRSLQLARWSETPYQELLYEHLLPDGLLSEVEELWGSKMLVRSPNRVVTEPFPHVAMAEAFGPALRFWHGCALTAWFLCEGSYSRTDMAGLEDYHHRELEDLEILGAPVDRWLFVELGEAEGRLGPEEPAYEQTMEIEVEPGVTAETSFAMGKRREGFEILRDIVTKHRRAWAERHLRGYLSGRAEDEIRKAAEAFHKMTHDRSGKPPTLKQFAKFAQTSVNHWFAGDVSALFRAFGEKSPVSTERVHEIPEDVYSFIEALYRTLGGTDERFNRFTYDLEERDANLERVERNSKASNVANLALEYLQIQEALGKAPTLKEFGRTKFERKAGDLLCTDVEEAYASFERLVAEARRPSEVRRRVSKPKEDRRSEVQKTGRPDAPRRLSETLNDRSLRGSRDDALDRKDRSDEVGRRPWWRRLFGG